MIEIIEDFIDEAEVELTPRVGGPITPKYLILYASPLAANDLLSEFIDNEDTKESTHVIVSPTGRLTQLAPFTTKTWHAGASYWQGHHGLNGFAIGIHISDMQHNMTGQQNDILHELIPALVHKYTIRDIVPHQRPTGMAVDVSEFKPYVEYGNADSVGRFVATAKLVVRGGPNVQFEGIDDIAAGESVKVLRYSSDREWAFVLYERKDHQPRHGWTHESFLRRL